MFDFIKFAKDFNINIENEGKNTAQNWINTRCPFNCGDTSNHLGYSLNSNYFTCWKCGGHSIPDTIQAFLDCSIGRALHLRNKYTKGFIYKKAENKKIINNSNIKFPDGTEELKSIHKNYLISRNFDIELLIEKYNILGTGRIGDYKYRIIAPIYYKNQLVSFQGRDITNKQKLRYKACSKKKEIIHHKYILYNFDNCYKNKVIVVEGITDVWRLGNNTIATFGIKYTQEQILLIAKRFKEVFVLFDIEPQAQEQGRKLAQALNGMGVKTEQIILDNSDPGDMSNEDAKYLKKQLLDWKEI